MQQNFWKGRRVFITGATGFVGSWLVKELLCAEAKLVVLVRDADPQSELYRSQDIHRIAVVCGALEDFNTLSRALNEHEIETVFHLGAQPLVEVALRSPFQTFESNIRGTYNLLEACRLYPTLIKQVVIASSDKAYGEHSLLPYMEDFALQGRAPYEVSKSCADMLAQSYYFMYGLPVGIARCGNIYGGGDLNWSRIVPGTIRSFLKGEQPIIRSDGKFIRDYIYIKDICTAYIRLAEALADATYHGQAFNFSPAAPMSVLDMVYAIQRLMNCPHLLPDIRNYARNEIKHQYLSAEKAFRLLGWQPEFTIETGLRETITWYQEYLR
ncbi:NAD-dependent epimerase/dehydratase [Candidatus Moduliflexus flocculans]|uniref:NAD-dependent epimerase/dehydratase n=1 Tax=Candidatus Moduliflexus flocculans TaxID=1499966 RepID=A0A081BMU1_9BACT|nr:NAD-dependent epimerase/dehydratase [Candidatus Moduliflexus flocculans]